MKIVSLVLCGGESQRMGRPKAWLPFGPELMLQRVVRLAGTVSEKVVVVAGLDQELPQLPDSITIVRDSVSGQGPLEGLAVGFRTLASKFKYAFATGTDTPFLQPAWILRLHDLIGVNDVAIPESEGRLHPLAALYHIPTVLPELEARRERGERRLLLLTQSLRTRVITPDDLRRVDPELKTLRNLNSPEDYQHALQELRESPLS